MDARSHIKIASLRHSVLVRFFSPSPRRPPPQEQRILRRRGKRKRDEETESRVCLFRPESRLPSVLCPWAPHLVEERPPSLSLLPPCNPFPLFKNTLKALGFSLPLPSALFAFPPLPRFPTPPSILLSVGAYTRLSSPACDINPLDSAQTIPRKPASALCLLDHASPTSFSAPNACCIPLAVLPLQLPTPPSAPHLDLLRPEVSERRFGDTKCRPLSRQVNVDHLHSRPGHF